MSIQITSAQLATMRTYAASQPCLSDELRDLDRMLATKKRLVRLFGTQDETYDLYYAQATNDISQSTLNWATRLVPLIAANGDIL
jgi:hypothetical protein